MLFVVLAIAGATATGVALGIGALALTGGIAYVVSRRGLGLSRATTGSVVNAGIHGNTSYLGLPVLARVRTFLLRNPPLSAVLAGLVAPAAPAVGLRLLVAPLLVALPIAVGATMV